jgi:hypothetical protein
MIIEKEFKKITGPTKLYGYIKINAIKTNSFSFMSEVDWPPYMDSKRYEEFVCKGIKEAIQEYGYSPQFGTYSLIEVKISKKIDESVPIAYYFAAKQAMQEFLALCES